MYMTSSQYRLYKESETNIYFHEINGNSYKTFEQYLKVFFDNFVKDDMDYGLPHAFDEKFCDINLIDEEEMDVVILNHTSLFLDDLASKEYLLATIAKVIIPWWEFENAFCQYIGESKVMKMIIVLDNLDLNQDIQSGIYYADSKYNKKIYDCILNNDHQSYLQKSDKKDGVDSFIKSIENALIINAKDKKCRRKKISDLLNIRDYVLKDFRTTNEIKLMNLVKYLATSTNVSLNALFKNPNEFVSKLPGYYEEYYSFIYIILIKVIPWWIENVESKNGKTFKITFLLEKK